MRDISESRHYSISMDSFGNAEVTIRKVTPSDEGLYYCMASNKSGRAKASATLHVLGRLNSLKNYDIWTDTWIFNFPNSFCKKFKHHFYYNNPM